MRIGQADWGARLDALDWQVTPRVQTEGHGPAAAGTGAAADSRPALQVRFRGEVADRRFDDAVRTAKTMFALARHLGEHPTVAGNWVGLSRPSMALDTLEEMVQQPGCPNLYWALTDLPDAAGGPAQGLAGRPCRWWPTELKPLRDDAAMTEAEVERVRQPLSGSIGFVREQAGLPPRNLRGELRARAKDADQVQAARNGCRRPAIR